MLMSITSSPFSLLVQPYSFRLYSPDVPFAALIASPIRIFSPCVSNAPKRNILYYCCCASILRVINTTHPTWLELMALMSYYFARLWKHISSIFGTIGRREHIQRFLTILRNFGMREPINGILNTSLLEIKGRLYRLLHIINEFSHLRIHSFPLINIPS